MIILVNSSLAEGTAFADVFVLRIILISLAAIYVVKMLRVLDAFWPKKVIACHQ